MEEFLRSAADSLRLGRDMSSRKPQAKLCRIILNAKLPRLKRHAVAKILDMLKQTRSWVWTARNRMLRDAMTPGRYGEQRQSNRQGYVSGHN